MLTRRDFLSLAAVAIPAFAYADSKHCLAIDAKLTQLERTNGGRLGVVVLNTATGERCGVRIDERFAMCSTFKFLLAAAVLQRIDRHEEKVGRALAIPPKPLIGNSPLTEPHAGGTMTVAELCEAALIRSDNTAANLLLETIGGPSGVTKFCRSIGDEVTRLDRTETSLNEAKPSDPRDTTTPSAMADDLNKILLGDVLSPAARGQLTVWMQSNQTGLDKLRAGVPKAWRVADKTGSNGETTTNDIAVIWPTGRKPVIVAAYITECPGPESKRASMLRAVGDLVIAE